MEEFDLTILYSGEEQTFASQLQVYGYTYKFLVTVDEADILFEPDEEGSYRAIVNENDIKSVRPELLELIVRKLEEIRNS